MDPFSEQGLAAPSLYHGCSTDSNGDWTVVGKNNKPAKVEGKTGTVKSDAPCDEDSNKKFENQGSPPYKDSKNPFGYLHDDEDEQDPDEVTKNTKPEEMPPPRKKMKVDIIEEDWHQVCDEFKMMPAPEYTHSEQPRQIFHIDTKTQDVLDESHIPNANEARNQKLKFSNHAYEEFKAYEEIDKCFDDSIEIDYNDNGKPDITLNRKKILAEFQKVEKNKKFQQYIHQARTLPKMYDMCYPVISQELYPNNFDFRTECQFGSQHVNDQDVWASHGQKKKNEQLREESTFLMYELTRLGMFPQYKTHYGIIEDTLDAWRVPHQKRSEFRRHELNYLSLMIHDTLPEYYMDYLLPKDEEPKGRIYNFFHKSDDSLTARYKWYAAIKNNYKKFYETILNDVDNLNEIEKELRVTIKDILFIMLFIS